MKNATDYNRVQSVVIQIHKEYVVEISSFEFQQFRNIRLGISNPENKIRCPVEIQSDVCIT